MDRGQLARECVKVEKAGCSVREFLHSAGCISPWGTWYRLQREELGRKLWQIQDGKGVEVMGKITLEQKKKAVEIAIAGKDPIPYLKDCGSDKPGVTWANIKRNLETTDPEAFRLLAENEKTEAEPEKPEIDMTIKAEARTDHEEPEMKLVINTADLTEAIDEEPEEAIGAPIFCDTLHVAAVRDDEIGEFYYDAKFNTMDWRAPDGT